MRLFRYTWGSSLHHVEMRIPWASHDEYSFLGVLPKPPQLRKKEGIWNRGSRLLEMYKGKNLLA
jgi:hypothetical protein